MSDKRPLIVVTNDDGVISKGISALIRCIRTYGEIVVMAPDAPRSGTSGAVTVNTPIHYQLLKQEVGLSVYKCSGTPVDCVKLAVEEVCSRKPDMLIAGINHGDNSATNVYNSGTMGAVIEGCIDGMKSLAFSLCNHDSNADFEPMVPYVRAITQWVMQHDLPPLTCLNINFPDVPTYAGVRVCKMARGYWKHEFDACPRRGDDHYYWLSGEFVEKDIDNEPSDRWALARNYVAITPTRLDVTDYEYMETLQQGMDSMNIG